MDLMDGFDENLSYEDNFLQIFSNRDDIEYIFNVNALEVFQYKNNEYITFFRYRDIPLNQNISNPIISDYFPIIPITINTTSNTVVFHCDRTEHVTKEESKVFIYVTKPQAVIEECRLFIKQFQNEIMMEMQ